MTSPTGGVVVMPSDRTLVASVCHRLKGSSRDGDNARALDSLYLKK
jgi:hypothetical protein